MKLKTILIAAFLASPAVTAAPMSVNVSGPGAVNPFFGYRMSYTDNSGVSCTFRFNNPGDGLSYLTADKECPSFVTEDLVFDDAQKAYSRMRDTTHALTFAEYFGDDGHGNKVKRAELSYRCADFRDIKMQNTLEWAGLKNRPYSGYMFMPKDDLVNDGWYRLDFYPNGYKSRQFPVGAWKMLDYETIIAVDEGRKFTISYSQTKECASHPIN